MADMHHKLIRVTARTALIGTVIVLGSAAAAQGAMAKGTPGGIVTVPCSTPALISALSSASYGQKLQLAFGCTYQLTAPLPIIDTDLTIVGFGATLERSEADGTQDFTILTVDGGDINLVEVNFRNGGGIDVNYGGGIDNEGGNITVLGGTFTSNYSDEYGGAIYNDSGTLTLVSAYFIGNYGNYYGGAIYNGDTMTLRSSHFLENEGEYGGAIYNQGTAAVIGTTFTRSSNEGGALFNDGQTTLSSVTVQHNYANYGGGIYNDTSPLIVDSSNIVSNYADSGGGGIFNDDGSVTLSLTKVSGNTPDNCESVVTTVDCSG
jgi:predicted outer membrane repeat protein